MRLSLKKICLLTFFLIIFNFQTVTPSLQKKLSIVTALGASGSFLFWLPETIAALKFYGLFGAILTTHIPRVTLDVLTVKACLNPFCTVSARDSVAINLITGFGAIVSSYMWYSVKTKSLIQEQGFSVVFTGTTFILRHIIDTLTVVHSGVRLYEAIKEEKKVLEDTKNKRLIK